MDHSPDPWTIEDSEIRDAGDGTVAIWSGENLNPFWLEDDLPQELANAHLIKAAPKLLKALLAVLPDIKNYWAESDALADEIWQRFQDCHAAIASARGED